MSSDIYEMLWDCQFCGTKKNLGLTHRFCPNCGAPQNPDARYYPADDEKVAAEDHEYTGRDVTCPACGTLNSARANHCGNCGSPLEEGERAAVLEAQSRARGEQFESSGSRDVAKERFDGEMERVKPNRDDGKVPAWLAILVLLGAFGIGVLGFVGFGFFYTTSETLIVEGHQWERTITVEEYRTVRISDWRDSRPSGDNMSIVPGSCRREERDTRRVPDGETCRTVREDQGDGTYREREECTTNYRSEPVYDDKCTWEGQRFETVRTAAASGNLAQPPDWPATNITTDCTSGIRIGCERERGRSDSYTVIFRQSENRYECDFPQGQWAAIPLESVWDGEVRMIGGLICESLQRR